MTKPARSSEIRLLLVEDSEEDAILLVRELKRQGMQLVTERVEDGSELAQALKNKVWDLVVSDFNLPTLDGMRTLQIVQDSGSDLPVILVSGAVGEEVAVAAMKAGARDFVSKGNLSRLGTAINRELAEKETRSQRTQLEAELRQAQKLEGVGRLAGGVAHDFNNLLTVIKGFVELSLPDVEGTVHENLMQVLRAADSAQRLATDLLAFSRRSPHAPQVLDLAEAVRTQSPLLKHLIRDDIRFGLRLDRSAKVKIDPTLLEQVMMNLVVNARDAMPTGGILTIETATFNGPALDGEREGDQQFAVVSVRDTGVGMSEETRSQIFEPFFTTKDPGSGTGLGLATCYGIVSQAGGRIDVRSELGVGTSFDVIFPVAKEEAFDSVCGDACAPTERRGGTILLVEDQGAVRLLAATALEANGYAVIPAPNGKIALEFARAPGPEKIDLLLSDVMMPMMGGIELGHAVREFNPSLKIAFMSGYSDGIAEERTKLTPHFLPKPFSPSSLVEFVANVLAQDSTRSATEQSDARTR